MHQDTIIEPFKASVVDRH